MMRWLIIFIAIFNFSTSFVVKTKLGNVKGQERSSRDHRQYFSFSKIPYAEAPVGPLRFKNPLEKKPWNGELDATMPTPLCIQMPSFAGGDHNKTVGQEDCLYLNIFTPSTTEKLPVLVYVHGGGFRIDGAGPIEGADYFMDENIILVTIQYRLGPLGFLSTEDNIIPGNFGLKDQALAIKWISENIDSFGGDPKSITPFGPSAGGASTHFLAVSPLSKDLIKGFISESGVINKLWASAPQGSARPLAFQLAEHLQCTKKSDSKELLECFQEKSAESIIRAETKFWFWDGEPAVVFRPVPEPPHEGAFMTENPLKMTTNLPWITGVCSDEGIIKSASVMIKNSNVLQQFIDNIDEFIPKIIFINESSTNVKDSVEMIKRHYFIDLTNRTAVLHGIQDFFSDAFFNLPMIDALDRHKNGPVFVYLFDYRAGSSLIDVFYKNEEDLGVSHIDEVLSLFNWTARYPKRNPDDEAVSRTLVRMWANFAKFQKPTVGEPEWKPYEDGQFLHITRGLVMDKDFKPWIKQFWHSLPMYKIKPVKTELRK